MASRSITATGIPASSSTFHSTCCFLIAGAFTFKVRNTWASPFQLPPTVRTVLFSSGGGEDGESSLYLDATPFKKQPWCLLFVVNGALTSKQTIKACQSSCSTHVRLLKTGPLINSMNSADRTYSTILWQEDTKLLTLFSYIYGCYNRSFVCNWYIILSVFALLPNSINPFVNSLTPMLLFFISCFSFILLSNFSLKPLLPWGSEMKLLSPWYWGELWGSLVSCIHKGRLSINSFLQVPFVFPLKTLSISSKVVNAEKHEEEREDENVSLLDLPELALESILQRLSPAGLCSMARVCTSLRDMCRSDHLWEKHMKEKWGRVIGPSALREWQWHMASRKRPTHLKALHKKGLFRSLLTSCPLFWIRPNSESCGEPRCSLPVDSIKAWYLSLESGKLWFPAQVYNRENGHLGFVMSCYDAFLCYDSCTGTFRARYSPPGHGTMEENIPWHRIRAPPIDVPAHVLHASDCLHDLRPEDHIEIQWRKSKELPYGWWYGVISHLETCSGNENHCYCHNNDLLVLEFSQYAPGSQWRRIVINRKNHQEEGNETDGFYGGIRKICNKEEISIWKGFWPAQVL